MGSIYTPMLLGGLTLTAWFKRTFLAYQPMAMAVDTLRDVSKVWAGDIGWFN